MNEQIERPSLATGLIRRMLSGKPPIRACTIVARNYLAQAEVFASSFKRHHPDCPCVILVVDQLQPQESRADGVELLTLEDIALEQGDAYRMPMIYNVTELSTAVKPWLLRRFLNGETSSVMYFDPDIEIFAPLYDLAELARKHSIVLTPHVTEPIPQDSRRLSESDILGSGIYNLGFIAIGAGSEPFLDWWAARLRRESVIDPARMRFTDQRWIDFVPGLFSHYILRDPAFNVAYWNLHSRKLIKEGSKYTVNGQPLRFFHFSGFNPDFPHILSKHQGDRPRVLLSEEPGVAQICKQYRKNLLDFGFNETKRNPYGFDQLSNGLKLDFHIRKLYREALTKFELDEVPEPPSPFAPGQEQAFIAWLNEPMRPAPPLITRFMMEIYAARPDLQAAFPDPLQSMADRFYSWFLQYGRFEQNVHESLVPESVSAQGSAGVGGSVEMTQPANTPLVNVAGYLRAELGIGEAARLLITGLRAANVATVAISYNETLNRQTHPFENGPEVRGQIDLNVICVNADQTPVFAKAMGPSFYEGRHTVGVWFWEVEDFPEMFRSAFDCVDEVWVATDFIRDALLKVSPKPVFKFALPIIRPPLEHTLSRSDVGLPDNFSFLFSFDFLSVFERKNPVGVIKAFKRAFKAGEGPTLVIKTINGDKRLLDLEKLKLASGNRRDIIISDGYLSPMEKNSLMAQCECYVSLHRSEGYGLTMAEAMALGKPVIATAYSGNLEFMTPENSYLCSFEYRQIGEGADPYPPACRWAEPNLDEAADYMRKVYRDRDEAMARGLRAADDIRTLHSPAIAGGAIADRVAAIRAQRSRLGKVLPADVIEARLNALEALPRTLIRVSDEDKERRAKLEAAVERLDQTIVQSIRKLETQLAEQSDSVRLIVEQHAATAARVENARTDFKKGLRERTAASEAVERNYADLSGRLLEYEKESRKSRLAMEEESQRVSEIAAKVNSFEVSVKDVMAKIQERLERDEEDRRTAEQSRERLHTIESELGRLQAIIPGLEEGAGGLEQLRERLQTIESELGRLQAIIPALEEGGGALEQLRERLQTIESELGRLQMIIPGLEEGARALEQLRERLPTLGSELGRLQAIIPPLQEQTQAFADVNSSLQALKARVEGLASHIEAEPFMNDRTTLHSTNRKGQEVLGYQGAAPNSTRADLYFDFEGIFRGSEGMIRERQRGYVDMVRNHDPVVDLGCGRGEMLDLLRENNISAIGVDLDPGMVARTKAKGHEVVQEDVVGYLAAQPDHSIGTIFSAQVIEHLTYEKLLELLSLSATKLKAGGLLILETVNPHSHRALKTFWVDPTHNKPLFPEVLLALCKNMGYAEAVVHFPSGTGKLETDRLSQGEYAVIAKTPVAPKRSVRRNGPARDPDQPRNSGPLRKRAR